MKIAILSDTHVGQRIPAFPSGLEKELSRFDAIIHCGDYTDIATVEMLREFPQFHGVRGNMDSSRIREILPETLNIELGGIRIGVIHGWGAPDGLVEKVRDKMQVEFQKTRFDIVFFGHSHVPSNQVIDNTRFINPGALSGNIDSSTGTWLALDIRNGRATWELKEINPRE